jgi:hypothetical protein
MTATIQLPHSDGRRSPYVAGLRDPVLPAPRPARCRVAYAAAHVVCDPLADIDTMSEACLDWEATLAYRRYLWSLGLSVAEAMDTAQRGMGLTWQTAQELIRRSAAEARACGGAIACGAGTDHLELSPGLGLEAVEAAYEEQCEFVEAQGARVIVMASRALAHCARGPDDYLSVYDHILTGLSQPAIIHWLGDMFDPGLAGYWGYRDLDTAMNVCLEVIAGHAQKVDGVKVSLLDADREVIMRRRLPPGVRMYSGDDYNYPELIRGDADGYSDALLGIFDAIAPAASAALGALDEGDTERYGDIFGPTVPLSRHIFAPPTRYYKTGVVFMAYLNGHQRHFRMVGGLEGARSIPHLCRLFVLADEAGLLRDPDLSVERLRRVLALAGID